MVVKRRKIGNTTVTINTKTGRQTTSRRSGNITYSQSNQGHNKTTVTTNYGNGWFDRKTTNWNKKSRRKKSDWSWLFGSYDTPKQYAQPIPRQHEQPIPRQQPIPIQYTPPRPTRTVTRYGGAVPTNMHQ